MRPVVVKYGIISGIILIAMIAVMIISLGPENDFDKGSSYGNFFMIAAYIMIFLGIREYRDKHEGGSITFNKGFRVGIQITLVASIFYVVGWMIFYYGIDPHFYEKYETYYLAKIQSSGKSAAEIEAETNLFKNSMSSMDNPALLSMNAFLKVFPAGLIITILCAFLMRSRNASQQRQQ